MRSWRLISLCAVVFVAIGAISATVLVRTARSSDELRAYLAGRFHARPDCPLAEPFVETNVDYDCFDGSFASGRPVVLILGHEVGSRTTEWSYIGVFLDDAPAGFGAGFFVGWRLATRPTPEKIETRLRNLDVR